MSPDDTSMHLCAFSRYKVRLYVCVLVFLCAYSPKELKGLEHPVSKVHRSSHG